ncbi:MAG: hypothetical protein Q9163_005153 [Psora crenata]
MDSPPSLNTALARSRSRYKHSSPTKALAAAHIAPIPCSDQSHPPNDCTVPEPTTPSNPFQLRRGMGHGSPLTAQPATRLRRRTQRIAGRGRGLDTDDTCNSQWIEIDSPDPGHRGLLIERIWNGNSKALHDASTTSKLSPPGWDMSPKGTLSSESNTSESDEEGLTVSPPGPISSSNKSFGQPPADNGRTPIVSSSGKEPNRNISAPMSTTQGVAASPAFDAPISAINAGERRVTIKYNQSVISLPISPSTTPTDIILAASAQLSVDIKPGTAVLLESFRPLGLERPLRRYERIRDVMNSWANDAENDLTILPSPSGRQYNDLDMKCDSDQQPGDTSVHIYHSQQPNSWVKRCITLRADGQLLAAKKDSMINLCHLSDFDIYIPTARQVFQRLRPPKKLCLAIKSQQKSSMFLSMENFVHFFSTNDKTIGTQLYKAAQAWRGWYLAHVLGEGRKKGDPENPSVVGDGQQRSRDPPGQDNNRIQKSLLVPEDERTEQYRAPAHPQPSGLSETVPTDTSRYRHLQTRVNTHRKLSLPKKLTMEANIAASTARREGPSDAQIQSQRGWREEDLEPFAATGLLGRTYPLRKKAHLEREDNLGALGEKSPNMLAITDRELGKPFSQRLDNAPLVDLTPHYADPPQHRKGRGIIPEQIPVGGLIEAATSPDRPKNLQPGTTYQRPAEIVGFLETGQRSHDGDGGLSGYTRPRLVSCGKAPFSAGLLADHSHSQGDRCHGRGVKTGDRNAEAPMMNINEGSQYAPGSLLATMEKHAGSAGGLVIEREKTRELNIAIGEGL